MTQSIIESVLDADLQAVVQQQLGLEGLRHGKHIQRDHRRWKTGTLLVRQLWIAEIRPAFMHPAALAFITTPEAQRAMLLVKKGRETSYVGPITLATALIDPVGQLLQALDLRPMDDRVSLDGVSYVLAVENSAVQAAVRFANPSTGGLLDLEQAFVQVSRLLVEGNSSDDIRAYLREWYAYIAERR